MTRSSRSRDPDRENFQPDRKFDFWEEISIILPTRFHTSLRPVPLDEKGLPLFRTRRPLSADVTSPHFRLRHAINSAANLFSKINVIAFGFLLVPHQPSADPLERNRQNTATLETSERRFLVDAIYLALSRK